MRCVVDLQICLRRMSATPAVRLHLQPPAVQFALRRSQVLGSALGLLLLVQLLLIVAWSHHAGVLVAPLKLAVGMAVWLFAAMGVWRWWRGSATGLLHWDGAQWSLQPSQQSIIYVLAPEVHLDLQAAMLVSAREPDSRRVHWLWLEKSAAAAHWPALRRAVFGCAAQSIGRTADAFL